MMSKIAPVGEAEDLSRTEEASIVGYARSLEALYRKWEDLKGQEGDQLSAPISAIENRILSIPAASAVDAAVQVMLVSSLVEQLRVDRGSAKEELLDRLEGLTISAFGGLTRQLKLDLSALGGRRYMPGLVGALARCDESTPH